MYTITDTMARHIEYIKQSAKNCALYLRKDAMDILLDKAFHAYLFVCCANDKAVEFTPAEFVQECKVNENFFNYYLACAE